MFRIRKNAAAFEAIIEHAQTTQADLILASDPDCDRMGAAAPLTTDPAGEWGTFNGNQLSALLADFILTKHQQSGTLTPDKFIVTTLVTTLLLKRIADAFQIRCSHENLVGFKWIASVVDEWGPDDFLYGSEESHGFLVGQYCRDKDGAIACLLMSELAAHVKSQGISLHQHLDNLYSKYGFHGERLVTIRMEGSDGMKRMDSLMEKFRSAPPVELAGLRVVSRRDYSNATRTFADGTTESITGPTGNLVILETEHEGNYIAARPSGTEPKVKFYMFTYVAPESIENLSETKVSMGVRLDEFAKDLNAFADTV